MKKPARGLIILKDYTNKQLILHITYAEKKELAFEYKLTIKQLADFTLTHAPDYSLTLFSKKDIKTAIAPLNNSSNEMIPEILTICQNENDEDYTNIVNDICNLHNCPFKLISFNWNSVVQVAHKRELTLEAVQPAQIKKETTDILGKRPFKHEQGEQDDIKYEEEKKSPVRPPYSTQSTACYELNTTHDELVDERLGGSQHDLQDRNMIDQLQHEVKNLKQNLIAIRQENARNNAAVHTALFDIIRTNGFVQKTSLSFFNPSLLSAVNHIGGLTVKDHSMAINSLPFPSLQPYSNDHNESSSSLTDPILAGGGKSSMQDEVDNASFSGKSGEENVEILFKFGVSSVKKKFASNVQKRLHTFNSTQLDNFLKDIGDNLPNEAIINVFMIDNFFHEFKNRRGLPFHAEHKPSLYHFNNEDCLADPIKLWRDFPEVRMEQYFHLYKKITDPKKLMKKLREIEKSDSNNRNFWFCADRIFLTMLSTMEHYYLDPSNTDNLGELYLFHPKFFLGTFQAALQKEISLCLNDYDNYRTSLHSHIYKRKYLILNGDRLIFMIMPVAIDSHWYLNIVAINLDKRVWGLIEFDSLGKYHNMKKLDPLLSFRSILQEAFSQENYEFSGVIRPSAEMRDQTNASDCGVYINWSLYKCLRLQSLKVANPADLLSFRSLRINCRCVTRTDTYILKKGQGQKYECSLHENCGFRILWDHQWLGQYYRLSFYIDPFAIAKDREQINSK